MVLFGLFLILSAASVDDENSVADENSVVDENSVADEHFLAVATANVSFKAGSTGKVLIALSSLDSVPIGKLGSRSWDGNDGRHQNPRQSIVQKPPLRNNAVMVEIWLENLDCLSSVDDLCTMKTLTRQIPGIVCSRKLIYPTIEMVGSLKLGDNLNLGNAIYRLLPSKVTASFRLDTGIQ
jgi:hypothetical protein